MNRLIKYFFTGFCLIILCGFVYSYLLKIQLIQTQQELIRNLYRQNDLTGKNLMRDVVRCSNDLDSLTLVNTRLKLENLELKQRRLLIIANWELEKSRKRRAEFVKERNDYKRKIERIQEIIK